MENILDVIKNSRQLLTNCLTLCDKMETDFLDNKLSNEIKEEKFDEMHKEFKKLKRIVKIAKTITIKSIIEKSAKNQNGDDTEEKNVHKNNFFGDKNYVENGKNNLNSEKLRKVDKIKISNKGGENCVILSDFSDIVEENSGEKIDSSFEQINNNNIEDDEEDNSQLFVDESAGEDITATEVHFIVQKIIGEKDGKEKMIGEDKKSNLMEWNDGNIDKNVEKSIINSDNNDKIDESIEKLFINSDNDAKIYNNGNEEERNVYEAEKSNLMECDDDNIEKISNNDDKIDNKESEIVKKVENECNIKQCFVILEDISKADKSGKNQNGDGAEEKNVQKNNFINDKNISETDKKLIFDKDYFEYLKIDVDKLSEIPKFKNVNFNSNDKEEDDVEKNNKKKTDKENKSGKDIESKSKKVFESLSDANDSDSHKKSEHIIEIDLTNEVMNDAPLNSSESNTDGDSTDSFKPTVNNIAKNDAKRRITRSLKIPLLSDNKTSYKTGRKSVKTSTFSITSSNRQSDDELDSLLLECRNLKTDKRQKQTKSIEGSKKRKLEEDSDGKDGSETSQIIRKVLTEAKLSEATTTAELFEIERKKRLQEKKEMVDENVTDANHSDLNQKSDHVIHIDLTEEVRNKTLLSSSESNTDDSYQPIVNYRAKSKFKRRITESVKIPLISDSETSSETNLKSVNTSTISTPSSITQSDDGLVKKTKKRLRSIKGSKTQKIYDEKGGSKTRKNIRKVLTEAKLSEATKTAELFEMERKKRLQEKKEMYNNSLTRQTASEETLSSLIIEKDGNGDVLVEVHGHIAEKLKPHQVEVVHFMYDCVIESVACLLKYQGRDKDDGVEEKESSVGGCIVAHCMGLGKTLSLIAFMHTMLTTPVLNLSSCIIVCPVNTALNWKREWEMWVPPDMPVKIFEVCSSECKKSKITIVQDWYKKGGVLIIGYEMFRLLTANDRRTIRNKVVRDKIQEALVNPGADFIVCDEGHLLKNEKSAISKVINKVKTRCRIVLTGTPLQNRLLEYHTMVNFVKPNLLGTQKEFLNRFVNPISNGQHINSTPYDVNVMKKRSHILFKTLDGCVHRRDYSALVKYLPPKFEYVIKIRMSEVQRKLYEAYLALSKINKQGLFQDQTSLARIWTHPFLVCMHQEIQDKKMFFAESDGESFLDDDSDGGSEEDFKTAKKSKKPLEENNIISLLSDESDNDKIKGEKKKQKKEDNEGSESSNSSVEEVVKKWGTSTRSSRRNKLVDSDDEPKIDIKFELESLKDTNTVTHWWSDIISPEHEHQIEVSGKLTVLFQILRKAGDMGDKVIIFSHSLLVLDLIERYLLQLHNISETVKADLSKLTVASEIGEGGGEAVPEAAFFGEIGYNSWEKGIDYDRMDGSTHVVVRSDIQARFNNEKEKRLRLFLISTKAGGMGVNLVAANRIVIFDVSWNPSNDIQAIFRSYRFGQNKPVYVYRLVSQGTMEEKMYERQVTKQSLSLRVVDEQQISRYFTEEDLRSLYKFEPDIYNENDKERETPILPKDRFLAELIQEFPQWIVGYHEHDSLLQNKNEEELTEAERQEAWKEFEDEKIRGTRQIHNPLHQQQISIDPNLFAQSQMALMQQHYPQYAAIYAQNYMNLLRYALSQQPDLKYNPTQLSVRMQAIFFMSLQKYNNNNNNSNIASSSVTPADITASSSSTTAAVITVDKDQSASSSSSSIMVVPAPEEITSQLNNE